MSEYKSSNSYDFHVALTILPIIMVISFFVGMTYIKVANIKTFGVKCTEIQQENNAK